MPRSQYIQKAFTSGYISKNMYGRVDTESYKEGLAECINFMPKPQGALERRNGREHILDIPNVDDGMAIPFILRNNDAFTLVLTDDSVIRPIDKRGIYIDPGSPEIEGVANPNLELGEVDFLETVTDTLSDNTQVVTQEFVPAFGHVVFKSSDITAYNKKRERTYLMDIIVPVGSESHDYNIDLLFDDNPTTTSVKVGTTVNGEELGSYHKAGAGRLSFNISPAGADHVYLTFVVAVNVAIPENGLYYISKLTYVSMASITDPGIPYESMAHPYLKGQFNALQHDFEPEGNAVWVCHESHEPLRISYDEGTGLFLVERSITDGLIVDPPDDWSEGNYPGSVVFHQGRLWFAGTRKDPATLYASKAGEYLVFTEPGNNLTDNSPLRFTLSRYGNISWLSANKELLVGTTSGEFRIYAGGDSLVNAGTVVAVLESTYGSLRSQPVSVANRVVFATEDGRRLRDLGYLDSEGSWVSIDLTLAADDITLNRTISHLEYSKNPDHIVRCLMDDGTIIVCVYRKSLGTVGWYEEVTDGTTVSLASVLVNGNTETIYLTKRGNQNSLSVEWEAPRDEIFLDNYSTNFNSVKTVNVSFPHLADKFVSIYADGAVQPDIQLDTNGDGIIQYQAFNITAGIPYTSFAKTLPLDSPTKGTSSTAGFMKRFNKIWMKLNRSAMPVINDERPPSRTPKTPMNIGQPIEYSDVQVANMGWDKYGQITISQNLPYPCVLASIYGEVSEDQL